MGQQPSKDQLLYQYACSGNADKIKALFARGAELEWIDELGRTPLILACMRSRKYNVAKTLIELGANVNAYCPVEDIKSLTKLCDVDMMKEIRSADTNDESGSHAGTPLHHAVEKGLKRTVKLLLSHGANALVMNDDSQTPLDVARVKHHSKIVRAIESHICLFSGWLREPFGPVILEVLAPQLLSRKVWVTVLPCASRNLAMPLKLELAIYSSLKDSQPRDLVALSNANMGGIKFIQSDHTVIISDIPNSNSST
ncbi:hypothetical protein RHSIM_Rhsim04G0180100 [Rhododendron simsii]|uniref:Uncharacterized protein n=1 Tax=Rhododendron simsii TaxID=118357 RepID=A0A834LRB2_RHOSS|nr:hypothetical protein RHSIM_Rhsim04G0180100 [Rhododendron simsii]